MEQVSQGSASDADSVHADGRMTKDKMIGEIIDELLAI